MKKAAILFLAAFYLLLTTGRFVCVVHCGAEKLFAKPEMQMAGMHKNCTGGNECGCCQKHGSLIIKENFKPGYDFQFTQSAFIIAQIRVAGFLLNAPASPQIIPEYANAPPGKSGKAISIQFRSLLI
jgi:hypothetical protein